MNSNERDSTQRSPKIAEGGYGSPTPEEEMPQQAATDPGGTDDQPREKLSRAEGNAMDVDADNDTPLEVPSTDAPLNEDNAGPTRRERESFSSESDDDAAGDPHAN